MFTSSGACPAEAPLGSLALTYDPAVWEVAELSGRAALQFTCVSVDCPGRPVVLAVSTATPDNGGPEHFFEPAEFLDSTPLAFVSKPGGVSFSAWSRWSGCRARDTPTLSAYGEHGSFAYHFSTNIGIGDGCNFAPELPEFRFLELLTGLKARE